MNRLDNSPLAKSIAGNLAMRGSRLPGAARQAWETAEGAAQGAYFLWRLQNPLDPYLSSPGESAHEQLTRGIGHMADKGRRAIADPGLVADSISRGFDRMNKNLNPAATPQGKTLVEEVVRSGNIGLNQGALGFDVASSAFGGAEIKALSLVGKGAKGFTAADYLARGMTPHIAEYMAKPYSARGMGHHVIPRRTRLPDWMGGGPVPEAILESPLFLLKPKGVTNGEMFMRHYAVDNRYYGGKVPAKLGGGGWSGQRLGFERYDPVRKLWYGTTPPMKSTLGGGAGLGAGAMDQMSDSEDGR